MQEKGKYKLSDKAQLATDHYIANVIINPKQGYTWAQAMREAAYAESTIDKKGNETWGMVGVQEQITAKRGEIQAESKRTVESLDLMYQSTYDQATTLKQPSAAVSAITGIARLYGMDKDNDANRAEQPVSLNLADIAKLRELAQAQTKAELSQPKLVTDKPQAQAGVRSEQSKAGLIDKDHNDAKQA